jgi:NAD(P)-dependent dehydrogenase (short-subunit alcohol dehydrogenase family)
MKRTIFITGVGSGIGLSTAALFAQAGWNVVGTVRRFDEPHPLADRPDVRLLRLDVTDSAGVERTAREAIAAFGRIDVVVNNAGYFQMGALESTTMEQVRRQFETNVFGVIAVTQAFLPHLRTQGFGMLVNVASSSAENGYPFGSVYSATKGCIASLTEALNVELDPIGVQAKAVFPGLHATRIFTKVDVAAQPPSAYLPLLRAFLRQQRSVRGSHPDVVAKVIWTAVHDGRADRVRYYAGPDATMIPTAKRLLGHSGYWSFFRRTLLHGPGPLLARFMPQGDTPVEVGANVLALQCQLPDGGGDAVRAASE